MLVTKLYFKMKHLLPVANEPEITWFDDAGMNGPHANLVEILSFDGIKWVIIHHFFSIRPVKRVTDRFQPWVPGKINLEILMDLTFKCMKLEVFCGEGLQQNPRLQGLFM